MNKVILIGNLTREPETSTTPNGVTVCRFSVAVSRDYANANGERETDFFNITAWRKTAENCGKYLKKGNKVAVIGSLQNRTYDDKEGVSHTVTDIIANEVEFLTPKGNGEVPTFDDTSAQVVRKQRPQLEAIDDDNMLPF